jgi:probable F420-dependent oxidoreductase
MKIGTGIGGWLTGVGEGARKAEEQGYDFVTCGELSHDSMLTMTVAATATQRIELLTGVTIAFPRSPMVLAMEAWDLQHYTKGRFAIGLGSQVKGHNERRFGGTWSAPAPRMKEYIQMMQAVWDSWQNGTKPEFLGKSYKYTLMTPNFNPGPLEYPRPKIFLAVVGDAMARVAGEVADGILPHGGIMTDKYMREVMLPNIKIGLERSGRTWDDIDISASGYTVYGENDAEIHKNLDGLRQALSFYGSTRTYHDVLELHGLKYLGDKLHQLSLRGEWQKMREVITDEELLELAQVSTYDKMPQFLREHREYAKRTTLGNVRYSTPDERARAHAVMKEVQKTTTPGVPRGMEISR